MPLRQPIQTLAMLVVASMASSAISAEQAVSSSGAERSAAPKVPEEALSTSAALAIKKLPREELLAASKVISTSDAPRKPARHQSKSVSVLDEIEVVASYDPADYTRPQKAPMIQFREALDKQRPLTPAEMSCLALSIVGLCGRYGPDGAPVENKSLMVSERSAHRSTAELATQFRGTVQ